MASPSLRRAAAPVLALPLLLLAACATVSPREQVRAGLVDAGLSDRMAWCMADRMVDRLSMAQLRKLKSFASMRDADMGGMTVDRFLHKLRALEDPEIFSVTSRAALGCAISG